MSRWNTPGVGFREIDNTIRPNADPGDGIGAIVFQANQGPPNQRVLSTSIDKFHEYFGEPDSTDQYGHFAAQVYFTAGGASQLLGVRATMGDEGYAQIQFPYTDSLDINETVGYERLSYTDQSLVDHLEMVTSGVSADAENVYVDIGEAENYVYGAKSLAAEIEDYSAIFYGTSNAYSTTNYVFRESVSNTHTLLGIETHKNYQVSAYTSTSDSLDDYYTKTIGTKNLLALIYTEYSGNDVTVVEDSSSADSDDLWVQVTNSTYYGLSSDETTITTYYKYVLHIPSSMGPEEVSLTIWSSTDLSSAETTTLSALISGAVNCDTVDLNMISFLNWMDLTTNTLITSGELTTSAVSGMQYVEYGNADPETRLITSASAALTKNVSIEVLTEIADSYGLTYGALYDSDEYAVLQYVDAETTEACSALIIQSPTNFNKTENSRLYSKLVSGEKFGYIYKYTWVRYIPQDSTTVVEDSCYWTDGGQAIAKPWQVEKDLDSSGNKIITQMIAKSSTEVFADSTGIWADGYTTSTQTDSQPGNGDVEEYTSNKKNQLIIAAIGPGKYGNNIGISVITPAAAEVPALYHQNAFSWKYSFDDEDLVDSDPDGNDYTINTLDLIWKKLYKINVYQKTESKSESTWGYGLEALVSSPVESWIVSNDPTLVDENGNSLYAPYVINGNSSFIYVSKSSVEDSIQPDGSYALPEMTWSIYQMTGGTNSSLNNIKEKTKALNLYKDSRKAYFDYLFNVEAIESFTGKQKYRALQNRIAEIVSNRTQGLAIIQATSKEAKTIKKKLSEAKVLNFASGSYVAAYDDYDNYFDSYTSSYVLLPRSIAGAVACCYCDVYSYPWMAPAGVWRGGISYSVNSMTRLSDTEFGQLYNVNVNSAMYLSSYGNVIMGQKTMLKKESALNRIDVRKLCNYIEKHLESKLFVYLFQKNTSTTREAIRSTVDAFLSRIQSAEGIIEKTVEVVQDESDTHLVYVNISFIPAESIERIEVVLTLNRADSSLSSSES